MATGAERSRLESAIGALPDPDLAPGACCAALYENPGVRWVLGGELHPGGEATTRRALELIDLGPDERLLDIGCGQGESALLAARESGSQVVGVDLGDSAIAAARAETQAQELDDGVRFVCGDATELPFPDSSFDALLLECTLSTVVDKERAVDEMRRVLRAGGRAAISDVVVDRERLPETLAGPLAAMACVGAALDERGYGELFARVGLRVEEVERVDDAAARLAKRVEDRLRGARMLGFDEVGAAIDLVRVARRAIADGSLGYAIFAAAD
jgi:arsenite methyltransferase